MSSLNTVVRLVLIQEAMTIREDDASRAGSFAKNRGVMSRFFSGDILGDVVKLRSKRTGDFQWVVSGVSPDGELFLLTSRDGSVPKVEAAVVSSAAMVPATYNATPQSVAQIVRQKFPIESSDFNWGSMPGGKEREKREWESELATIQRAPHLTYIIANRLGVESSYQDSTGAETTAIGKALSSDAVDTALDLTGLATDLVGLNVIGSAITASQASMKVAKGDWLGLLLDFFGMVPAVGAAFESAGKRFLAVFKTTPGAIPSSAIKSFKEQLESVVTFITEGAAKTSVLDIIEELTSAGVTSKMTLIDAVKKGYEKHRVLGAIMSALIVLLGKAGVVRAIEGITTSAKSMVQKLAKALGQRTQAAPPAAPTAAPQRAQGTPAPVKQRPQAPTQAPVRQRTQPTS